MIQWLYDVRCPYCHKKLASAMIGIVRFWCPRHSCGRFVEI